MLGGVRFFSGLHVLVLFVILGVGADDIFVLVDAWKQVLSRCGGFGLENWSFHFIIDK